MGKSNQSFVQRDQELVRNDPGRILRRKAAAEYLGMTAKTLRVRERAGEGPPRVQLGPNSVGYRKCDLVAWLEGRITPRPREE